MDENSSFPIQFWFISQFLSRTGSEPLFAQPQRAG